MPPERLPIDRHLDAIRGALAAHRALVLTAAPGAGKTTRVPPALVEAGRVMLLQPRRVAARAIAARIAAEQGWTLGREVGWQVRFERRFSAETRLLVVTEGILTARLQQDPLLSDFATIVLDEFHERSIHSDLGLALAKQAWLARDDLRLLVMSATLDGGRVSRYLGDCPHIEVEGVRHRLEVEYAPGTPIAHAVVQALARTPGNVLGFLAGAREIARAADEVRAAVPRDVDLLPLHGSLDADEQDAALRPSPRRRVVLATNIAETSLTVSGVSAVVDTGLQKVARYDPARAIDSLVLERVTRDSADQRAGRAARLGPGLALRLWDERDRLRPHREPDIARIDLSARVLDLLAWGADPATFDWFEAPPPHRLEAALALLARLGAIDPRLTATGRQMQRLPVHPRLARILLAAGGSRAAAAACALLAEGDWTRRSDGATTCDLLSAIDEIDRQPPHVRRVARQIQQDALAVLSATTEGPADDASLRRALLAGYPDRVARRRGPGAFTLATGHGATLGRQSGVGGADFVVALDVTASERSGTSEAVIRLASRVEREWLTPTSVVIEHELDASGRVRAFRVQRYDAIELERHPVPPDAEVAADLRARAWLAREPDEPARQLTRRAAFAGIDLDLEPLVRIAASGAATVDDIDVGSVVPFDTARAIARLAPERLELPSGRHTRLQYEEDGSVSAAVKLQELFGLSETPRVGPDRVPVTFHLLAPNGRPVQTTRDLASFWHRTYPEVRKELRGRYPRHAWPEDPLGVVPPAGGAVRR